MGVKLLALAALLLAVALGLVRVSATVGGAEGALARVYLQVSLNVNYSSAPAEQRAIAATVRRHLALLERYGIEGNYYFTGLAAEMLQEVDPGLIERLRELAAEGRITIDHHGANRPPHPMPVERVHGRDWEEDVQAILEYESYALDPATGTLDPSRPGGLKRMIETFGREPFSTGRFFQASILYVAKLFGVRMAVGLQENVGAPCGDAWFLGVLNRPDGVTIVPRTVLRWARGGPSPLAELEREVAALPRDRIRLVSLLMHDHDFFRGQTTAQAERTWERYEALLRWARERGYKPLSLSALYAMAYDDRERVISREELGEVAESYVAQVEPGPPHYPPDYIDLGDDCFSLADAWQALVQALAGYSAKGALPERVRTRDILGPTELVELETRPRTVAAEEVLRSAVAATTALGDRVPTTVRLPGSGIEIDAAEHLYLLTREFLALLAGTAEPVELLPIELVPRDVAAIGTQPGAPGWWRADRLTEQQFWTFKPARWRGGCSSPGGGASTG